MATALAAAEPPRDPADLLLWRSAQRVLERHRVRASPIGPARCGFCAEAWPCPSAVEAARASVLAGGPPLYLSPYGGEWASAGAADPPERGRGRDGRP